MRDAKRELEMSKTSIHRILKNIDFTQILTSFIRTQYIKKEFCEMSGIFWVHVKKNTGRCSLCGKKFGVLNPNLTKMDYSIEEMLDFNFNGISTYSVQ